MSDLRKIGFTIQEEIGAYITSPRAQETLGNPGPFVCLDCDKAIEGGRWMWTKPGMDGWRHWVHAADERR